MRKFMMTEENNSTIPMTLDIIEKRLEDIRELAIDDNASAHSEEDDLWENVLRAIAEGAACPSQLAEWALMSNDIQFERWYS